MHCRTNCADASLLESPIDGADDREGRFCGRRAGSWHRGWVGDVRVRCVRPRPVLEAGLGPCRGRRSPLPTNRQRYRILLRGIRSRRRALLGRAGLGRAGSSTTRAVSSSCTSRGQEVRNGYRHVPGANQRPERHRGHRSRGQTCLRDERVRRRLLLGERRIRAVVRWSRSERRRRCGLTRSCNRRRCRLRPKLCVDYQWRRVLLGNGPAPAGLPPGVSQ